MRMIRLAESNLDLERCFPVMHELRLHLSRERFLDQVRMQTREHGYRLAMLEENGEVVAVAGFRIAHFLAWGKTLYLDDLVTSAARRSMGYGHRLFDWLVDVARDAGCDQFHLDSGVQRFDAHRFYLRKRMEISSHHFSFRLIAGA